MHVAGTKRGGLRCQAVTLCLPTSAAGPDCLPDMSVPHGKWHIETEAVHAGEAERYAGAAITPIFQSATYVFDGDTSRGYDEVKYARCNNTPNHDVSPRKEVINAGICMQRLILLEAQHFVQIMNCC